jgi:hypothetical protein
VATFANPVFAPTGTGPIAFNGTGTATATVHASGTGAIAFGGSASATVAYTTSGTGALVFGGTGTATLTLHGNGAGAVLFGGSGTATFVNPVFTTGGTGAISFGGAGTATFVNPIFVTSGTGAIAFGGTGTAISVANFPANGTGGIAFGATGTATFVPHFSTGGTGAISFGGSGTATIIFSTSGTGAISFGGSGTALAASVASGTGAISFGGHGYAGQLEWTFTPPVLDQLPTYGVRGENRIAARVQRYYKPRKVGVAVFKMSTGAYWLQRQVPGLSGPRLHFQEPSQPLQRRWPPGELGQQPEQVNHTMETSWLNGKPTEFLMRPDIDIVYHGGTSYPVSPVEAADLEAAGLGAYLTSVLV